MDALRWFNENQLLCQKIASDKNELFMRTSIPIGAHRTKHTREVIRSRPNTIKSITGHQSYDPIIYYKSEEDMMSHDMALSVHHFASCQNIQLLDFHS
jgi:hypothetical protein